VILDQSQRANFNQILSSLYEFGAARLDMTKQLHSAGTKWGVNAALGQIMMRIWDDDAAIVTDFARINPDGLSGEQIAEARRWDQGISGAFLACRDEFGQSIFLGGGYTFAVTGLDQEPAEVVGNAPAFVQTVLVPFGGSIVYAGALLPVQREVTKEVLEAAREEIDRSRAGGRLVANASEFMRLVYEKRSQVALPYGGEEGYVDQALADLLGPARHTHRTRWMRAKMRTVICPRSIEANTRLGMTAPAAMTCRTAEDGSICEPTPEYLAGLGTMPPGQHRGALAGLVGAEREHAVHMRHRSADVMDGEAFTFDLDMTRAMPVTPLEFGEELLRLRGVEKLTTIARECVDYFAHNGIPGLGPHQTSKVSNKLLSEWQHAPDKVNYEVVFADGTYYLLEYMLAKDNWYEVTGQWHIDETDRDDGYPGSELGPTLRELLARREGLAPRPVPEDMFDHITDYFGWALKQPPMVQLRSYLDAHVPDGEDDYTYANDVMGHVLEYLHLGLGPTEVVWEVFDRGGCTDATSLSAVEWLAQQVADQMPSWEFNGWSPREPRGR
jgi:hypothetical protein